MDFPMETSETSPTKITSESHGTSVIFFAVFFGSLQGDSPQSIESGGSGGISWLKNTGSSGFPVFRGRFCMNHGFPKFRNPGLHQGGGVRH